MLLKVNDRSLSTNSYYTGGCAPALRLSAALCLSAAGRPSATAPAPPPAAGNTATHPAGASTADQAAGHRREVDRVATISRRPSAYSRIMVIMRTPSAAGRPAGASAAPGGGSSDDRESAAAAGDPAGTPPFFRWGAFFCPLSRISYPPPTIIQQLQHPYRATSTVTASPPPIKKQTRHIRPISVSGTLRIRFCVHLPCARIPVVLTPSVSHTLAPVFRFTGTSRRISHLTSKKKNRGGFKPAVQFLLSYVFSWIGL